MNLFNRLFRKQSSKQKRKTLADEMFSTDMLPVAGAIGDWLINVSLPAGTPALPPIGTIIATGTVKVIDAYSQGKVWIFNRNLKAVLNQCDDVTQEELNNLLKILAKDEKGFKEKLFVLLDRLDSADKSKVIGNLIRALAKVKIETHHFTRLCNVVDTVLYDDLIYMLNCTSPDYTYKTANDVSGKMINPNLLAAGLLNQELTSIAPTTFGESKGNVSIIYTLSPLGISLIDCGLKKQ